MPTPQLLIYVPTYNRAELAIAQLETLQAQLDPSQLVRVIVSDNASTKGDPEAIRRWCAGKDQFEFRQNSSNLGAEANFLLAFCLAKKDEHVWILADDTPVSKFAVPYLLNSLRADVPLVAMAPLEQKDQPETYSWHGDGIGRAMSNFQWGLISSAVYNMTFFKTSIIEGFRLHNSSFAHLAILFGALKERGSLKVTWLEMEKLHGDNWIDPSSDYSLALAGSPLLYTLAPAWETRKLSRSYLWHNSGAFIQAGNMHRSVFLQSRQLLFRHGGWPAKIAYLLGYLEYNLRKSRLGRWIDGLIERNPKLLNLIVSTGRLPFRIK